MIKIDVSGKFDINYARRCFFSMDFRNFSPSDAKASALGAICLHIAVLAATLLISGVKDSRVRSIEMRFPHFR